MISMVFCNILKLFVKFRSVNGFVQSDPVDC
jgi:hypothetical protein